MKELFLTAITKPPVILSKIFCVCFFLLVSMQRSKGQAVRAYLDNILMTLAATTILIKRLHGSLH